MHRLKSLFLSLFGLILCSSATVAAPSSDPFVQALNAHWVASDDAGVTSLIEKTQKERPKDIVVLVAAYNYYMLIQPDLPKLTEVVQQIKAVSDADGNNTGLKAFSNRAQTKLTKANAEGIKPVDAEKRAAIHKAFPKEFPGLALGITLQKP